jgi:hypothetical protein
MGREASCAPVELRIREDLQNLSEPLNTLCFLSWRGLENWEQQAEVTTNENNIRSKVKDCRTRPLTGLTYFTYSVDF